MSTTDGETSGRLDAALRDVFESVPGEPTLPHRTVDDPPPSPRHVDGPTPAARPADDWSVDGPDDEPYELPEIVPATKAPVVDQPVRETPSPAAPRPAPAPTAPQAAPQPAPTTSWGDHMAAIPANAQGGQLRAPGRRPRVRRVTRVLRHIDPWSTFKVGLLFSAVVYVVGLTSGVLLWRVADSTGTLANVERWFTQFGWETFELKGGEIFRNAWIIGLFGAVALTGALVLLATLFNLVSDIVGGVRVTVLEEEVVERTVSSARRYVVRRTPNAAGAGPVEEDWDIDGDADEPAPRSSDSKPPERSSPESTPTATDDWSVDDDDPDEPDDERTATDAQPG